MAILHVISHCSFDSPVDKWNWLPFHVLIGYPYVVFEEELVKILCPVLNQFVFIAIQLYDFLCILDIDSLIRYMTCKYFLPNSRLPIFFHLFLLVGG